MGNDRGEDAYRRENKTTTTLWSSSSSLVSLRRVLATSLTVTRSYSSVGSFMVLELWVCVVLSAVGAGYIVVGGRWSFNSRCWQDSLLLGCRCRSLGAGRCLLLALFFACGFRLGGCCMLCGRLVCVGGCVTWQRVMWRAHADDVGMHVVVVFRCQAVVVVCGWPGMFVVVGVMSGRRGGRLLLGWWLWDEEGSCLTICDNVTSESTFRCVCAIALGSHLRPNL